MEGFVVSDGSNCDSQRCWSRAFALCQPAAETMSSTNTEQTCLRDRPKLSFVHLLARSHMHVFIHLSSCLLVVVCFSMHAPTVQSCLADAACTGRTAVARLMHPNKSLLCEAGTEEQLSSLITHPHRLTVRIQASLREVVGSSH